MEIRTYKHLDVDKLDRILQLLSVEDVAVVAFMCKKEILVQSVECVQLIAGKMNKWLCEDYLGRRLQLVSEKEQRILLKGPFKNRAPYEAVKEGRLCGSYTDLYRWMLAGSAGAEYVGQVMENVEKRVIHLMKKSGQVDFPKSTAEFREQFKVFLLQKQKRDTYVHNIKERMAPEDCSAAADFVSMQIQKDNLASVDMDGCVGLVKGGLRLLRLPRDQKNELNSDSGEEDKVEKEKVEEVHELETVQKKPKSPKLKLSIVVEGIEYEPGKVIKVLGPHPALGRADVKSAVPLVPFGDRWSKTLQLTVEPGMRSFACCLVSSQQGQDSYGPTLYVDPSKTEERIHLQGWNGGSSPSCTLSTEISTPDHSSKASREQENSTLVGQAQPLNVSFTGGTTGGSPARPTWPILGGDGSKRGGTPTPRGQQVGTQGLCDPDDREGAALPCTVLLRDLRRLIFECLSVPAAETPGPEIVGNSSASTSERTKKRRSFKQVLKKTFLVCSRR